jgi:amino acid adenylation domain-containing protein
MENREIFSSAEKLCGFTNNVFLEEKYTELDSSYPFEFTSMPMNKSIKSFNISACPVHEYNLCNLKGMVAKLCADFSLKPNAFYECIWGIILKFYQYSENAEFLTIYSNGVICLRQFSEEQNHFRNIADYVKQNYFSNKLTQNIIQELEEYPNKTLFEFVSDEQSAIESTVKNLTLNLSTTIRAIFTYRGEDLKIYLFYNENYYNRYSLSHLSSSIENLIYALYAGKNDLAKINIMNQSDVQFLKHISGQSSDYCVEKTIPEMIELQTAQTPNNIAIYFQDNKFTYEEVNKKANYLAQNLVHEGVRKGDYVPVIMKRSPELIISLLSIMKVGAVFVPIDIQWHKDKIKNAILKCNNNIVLSNTEPLYSQIGIKTIFVSVEQLEMDENLDITVGLDDNIYAIFTSGSVGEPKGAINKHNGIINRFLYMNKRYKIQKDDVILMTSNHAFDSSVWQMFWPLINGNPTVIPKPSSRLDLFEIMRLIEQYGVTITDFVPSVFNLMVEVLQHKNTNIAKLSSLRQLLIGGEEMSPRHIYIFKELFPSCSITNTYGPAEASIGTVFYELPERPVETIPIGTPIDNVTVYILNRNEKLMPVGAIGMLCLGGICVGSGYVNEKERTEGVFKSLDVFEDDNLLYIYKTGDMVQFNTQWDLDFYGRNDSQVKIHGVRVELKEIENEMNKIKGIISSCATYLAGPDDKVLSLYFVSDDDDLKEYDVMKTLKDKLPSYIMSAYIKRIDSMPLTNNGKLNYKELPSLLKEKR